MFATSAFRSFSLRRPSRRLSRGLFSRRPSVPPDNTEPVNECHGSSVSARHTEEGRQSRSKSAETRLSRYERWCAVLTKKSAKTTFPETNGCGNELHNPDRRRCERQSDANGREPRITEGAVLDIGHAKKDKENVGEVAGQKKLEKTIPDSLAPVGVDARPYFCGARNEWLAPGLGRCRSRSSASLLSSLEDDDSTHSPNSITETLSRGPCRSYSPGSDMCDNATSQNYSTLPNVGSSMRSSCPHSVPGSDTRGSYSPSEEKVMQSLYRAAEMVVHCGGNRVCNRDTQAQIVSRELKTKFPSAPFSELSQSSASPTRRRRLASGRARLREKREHEPKSRPCRRGKRENNNQPEDLLSEISSVFGSGSSPPAAVLPGRQRSGLGELRGSSVLPARGETFDCFQIKKVGPVTSSGNACAKSALTKYTDCPSRAVHLSASRKVSRSRPDSPRTPYCMKEPRTAVRLVGEKNEIKSPNRSRPRSEKDDNDYDGEHWNELSCQLSAAFYSSHLSDDQDEEPHSPQSFPSAFPCASKSDSHPFLAAGENSSAPPTGEEYTSHALPVSPGAEPLGLDRRSHDAISVPDHRNAPLACCSPADDYVLSSCPSFLGTCTSFFTGSRGPTENSPLTTGQCGDTLGRDGAAERREGEILQMKADTTTDQFSCSAKQETTVRLCKTNVFAPSPGTEKCRHPEGQEEDTLQRDRNAGSSTECSVYKTDDEEKLISSRIKENQGKPQLSCENGGYLRLDETNSRSSATSHSFFSLSSPSSSTPCSSSSVLSSPSSPPSDTYQGKTHADMQLRTGRDVCKERVEKQKTVPVNPKGGRSRSHMDEGIRAFTHSDTEASTNGLTTTERVLASVGKGVTTVIECGAASLVDFFVDTLPRLSVEPDYTEIRVRTSGNVVRPRSCSPSLLRRERTRFSSVSRALSSCGLPLLCNPSRPHASDEQEKCEQKAGKKEEPAPNGHRDICSSSVVAQNRVEPRFEGFEPKLIPVQSLEKRNEMDKTTSHMPRNISSLPSVPVPIHTLTSSLNGNNPGGRGLVEGRLRRAPMTLEGHGGPQGSPNGHLSFTRSGYPGNQLSPFPPFVHPVSSPLAKQGSLSTESQLNWLPSSHSPPSVMHECPSYTPQNTGCVYPTDVHKTPGIAPFYNMSVTKSHINNAFPAPLRNGPLRVRGGDRTTPRPRGSHIPTLGDTGSSVHCSASLEVQTPPLPGAVNAFSPGVSGSCGRQTSRGLTPSTPSLVSHKSSTTEERTPEDFQSHAIYKLGALTPCTTATANTSVSSTLRQPSSDKQPLKVTSYAISSPSAYRYSEGTFVEDVSTGRPLYSKFVLGEEGRTSQCRNPSELIAAARCTAANSQTASPGNLHFSFSAPSGFCSEVPRAMSATELVEMADHSASKTVRRLHSTGHMPNRCQKQQGEEKMPQKRTESSGWRRLSGDGDDIKDIAVHKFGDERGSLLPSSCRSVNEGGEEREKITNVQRERIYGEGSARAAPASPLTPEASSSSLVEEERRDEDEKDEKMPGRKSLPAVVRARWLLEELRNQDDVGALTKENFPMGEVLDLIKHFDVLDVGGVSVYKLESDWTFPDCFVPRNIASEEWLEKNYADGVNFMVYLQEITSIATDLYREHDFPSCRLQSHTGANDTHAASEPAILSGHKI